MSDQRVSFRDRIRAGTLGLILLVVGACLCIGSSFGWLNGMPVNPFELGCGLAFLGIALG